MCLACFAEKIGMILSIFVAIFLLGFLIFIHEFGHFILAKREGMKVEEFGFGYPPRIFGKKIGETLYSLNLIPFGGLVKILGEQGDSKETSPDSFYAKPLFARVKVILGGVVMFWIMAYVILVFSHVIGIPTAVEDSDKISNARVQILYVAKNSPADRAGLKAGDVILNSRAGGEDKKINTVTELQDFTKKYAGEDVLLDILRGKESIKASVVPRKNPPQNEGPMGIIPARVALITYPWYQAIWRAAFETFRYTWFYITGLINALSSLLTTGRAIGVEPSGPVGIVYFTMQAFRLGASYFLNFLFSISIALAVCNLLPIPSLDGGKLLFLTVEKIKGSSVKPKTENLITSVIFIILLMVMVFITIRFDIPRFF